MGEARRLLHEMRVEVRWGDMDSVGHVNNVVYFTYFEEARMAWFATLQPAPGLGATGTGPVIANAYCNFRRAIVHPAGLRVRMHGGAPGRSSFETWYEIVDAADPALLYADGSSRVVWVDRDAGRSVALPAGIRALLPAA